MTKDMRKWMARLGRLRSVGIITTAFQPGVRGYWEEGPYDIHLGHGEMKLIEKLALQLHPELADEEKAIVYLKRMDKERKEELRAVIRTVRGLRVRSPKIWLSTCGYLLEGKIALGTLTGKEVVSISITGATPMKVLERFQKEYRLPAPEGKEVRRGRKPE